MKKVLGALGVLVLLAVLGVTLLFGYSVYKDINNDNSQENKVADESKSNKENNKEEINNENENNTQNQTEVQENNEQENQQQEVQNESTTEYPEDASTDVSNMNDLELMEYYTQYMDEEDREITEGRVENQRGNEYVDYIRKELTNNPDIIEEWAN